MSQFIVKNLAYLIYTYLVTLAFKYFSLSCVRRMSSTYTLTFLLCLCISSSLTKEIPSYINLCHRNDPKLNDCVRNAVEQIRPYLAKGVPELYLPSINPLVLPEAGLDSGDNFKASFKNIEVYYADQFKIDSLDINLDELKFDLKLFFPKLRIKSQYNINGRLLILQLQGQGPADGNLTDVSVTARFNGELKERKGKHYLSITSTKMDMELGKPVFLFENLFGNNVELNEQTNKIINENVVDIIDELRPVVEKISLEFAFGIVNRIFSRYSFEELFPK